MKKLRYLLFTIVMFLTVGTVSAAEVQTSITNASYDGNFIIEGTGTGQIQVVLFGLDGEPLYLTTVLAVNNLFSIELPKIDGIEKGNYRIKIANYDGTSVDSETVRVANSTPVAETNPQTGDKLLIYIILGVVSLIGILVGVIYLKRKKVRL